MREIIEDSIAATSQLFKDRHIRITTALEPGAARRSPTATG